VAPFSTLVASQTFAVHGRADSNSWCFCEQGTPINRVIALLKSGNPARHGRPLPGRHLQESSENDIAFASKRLPVHRHRV